VFSLFDQRRVSGENLSLRSNFRKDLRLRPKAADRDDLDAVLANVAIAIGDDHTEHRRRTGFRGVDTIAELEEYLTTIDSKSRPKKLRSRIKASGLARSAANLDKDL
jgi:hypothetical protein